MNASLDEDMNQGGGGSVCNRMQNNYTPYWNACHPMRKINFFLSRQVRVPRENARIGST